MAQKVASLYIKFDADSAALLNDMKKVIAQTKKMGRRVDREANRIKYAFNKIRRAAQVVASAFIFVAGIRQLGKLVSSMAKAEDSVKLLEARFKQFAREGDAFTRVYNLSKELGVSLDETAGGMTRLLVATKSIGTAQSTLEDVYKNIVLLGRAGGTSTEEMIGGMRQLSQGLASGRLQGEELRSVLENLPLVAMEIAKEMGIGIGQIRKAAAEGRITGEVVIAALENIGIKMEDLPQTWAMQTENLRTEWSLFLADLSRAVDEAGLLEDLTEAIKWVRVNMLGSFVGTSTEDLEKRLKGVNRELEIIQKPLWSKETRDKAPGVDFPEHDDPSKWLLTMYGGIIKVENTETLKLLDTQRRINEELERRADLDKMALKAAEARTAATTAAADSAANAKYGKSLASFLRQYETVEQKVARLQAQLEGFKNSIIAEFGEGEFKRIAFEIDKDLIQMIDTSLIPKLKKIPKVMKESTEEMSEFAKQAARNIHDAFADFFFDPFEDGLKGMVEGFLTAIRRMMANRAAESLFSSLGKSGGGIGAFFSSLMPKSTNAFGGFAQGGQVGLVGERGPELFIPSQNGNVLPFSKLGGTTNYYSFEAGADVATIEARIIPMLEQTERNAVARVVQRTNEGRM